MKTEFDSNGNATFSESIIQTDNDGNNGTNFTTRSISPEQLEKHMPMFEAKMTVSEKASATEIIENLEVKA